MANELGIYDMSGNVSEWLQEKYIDYRKPKISDYLMAFRYRMSGRKVRFPDERDDRVIRGGSLLSPEFGTRSAFSIGENAIIRNSYCGFRLARNSK